MTPREIEEALARRRFVREHATEKVIFYSSPHLPTGVYVNRVAGRSNSELILHPDLQARRNELLRVP